MRRPLIGLLTDFGDEDGYVGTLKGVLLRTAPRAIICDIAHHVTPHSPAAAAFVLWHAYASYPRDTVFVIVVDPGVGSARDILACSTHDGYTFIAPDNGCLAYVMHDVSVACLIRVDTEQWTSEPVSATFHGRDIMAPLAAALASGEDIRRYGDVVASEPYMRSIYTTPENGRVVYIDHFGTIITSVPHACACAALTCGGLTVRATASSYSAIPDENPCRIKGSSGLWEIACKNAPVTRYISCEIGDTVYGE